MAFPTGWGRVVPIVIDYTKVSGSATITDMPVLITKDNIPSEAIDAGSNSALNGGGDIRFSSDSAGTTQLPCQVVEYVTDATAANRVCHVWVKVPSISYTADTTIYMWYSKAGETQPAVTDTYGRNAVWSAFHMVHHLNETANTTAGGYIDSTGNGYDGTGTSMSAGNGTTDFDATVTSFDDSNDSILITAGFSTTDTQFTITSNCKASTLANDGRLLSLVDSTNSERSASALWMDSGGSGDGWQAQVKPAGGGVLTVGADSDNNASTSWQHIVHKYDSTNHKVFVDGTITGSASSSGGFTDGTYQADEYRIGRLWTLTGSGGHWQGLIGTTSIRLANVDDDVLKTEAANQLSPSTFSAAGTPSTPSGGGSQDISPTAISNVATFGTAVLTTGAVTLSPSVISSTVAFGSHTLNVGAVNIAPAAITNSASFGSATLSQGFVLAPNAIAPTTTFGTAVLSTGAVDVVPTAIATTLAFGSVTVTSVVDIAPTAITNTASFGTASVTVGAAQITPAAIDSTISFGTAVVTGGDVVFEGIGIDGQETNVINTDYGVVTVYFGGNGYFTI